mgnify:CR=1 FL=1
MKKLIAIAIAVVLLLTLGSGLALADPTDYDKKVDKGIYLLVAKDTTTWEPLPRATNPFGMGKFSIKDNTLTMHLVCHKLTPGDWYYVELVDKSSGWSPFNDDRYSRFYGQADASGDANIIFSWNITSHSDIEVNLKNADWVALLEPSAHGVPAEWIYTGQGWDYILYGATTIP